MRIAQVAFRFGVPGGVETTVRELAGRLARGGDEVTVFATTVEREEPWAVRADLPPVVDGLPVRWFPARPGVFPFARTPVVPGLAAAIAAFAPEVIHAHSHRYFHVLAAAAAARATGAALVVSAHYHPPRLGDGFARRGLHAVQDLAFAALAYRDAAAVVVESERERSEVSRFCPPERIVVIPPGIDPPPTPPASGFRRALPGPYVLYLGRLAPNKGLPTLVDALADLPPGERPTLVLAGPDGGALASLRSQAQRRGVGEALRILGPVNDERDRLGLLAAADAVVLPSEWEAFGLVLLEAMAVGTPVVASDRGGLPETLAGGRAGRLLPFGDRAAWARALGDARTARSDRGAEVEFARNWARGFRWDRAVSAYREVYRRVLGRGSRHHS